MHLRPALPEDAGLIATLLAQLGYPADAAVIAERIARLAAHPDAAVLVAGPDDTAMQGFIALHFIPQLALPGDFCRIAYFCVAPGARGRGVGRALEAEASRLAQARGCDRIEVHCHERRHGAHMFYRRRGYAESPKYLIRRP